MNEVKTIGIDLAKNAFALHGVDAAGKSVFRKMVRRGKLLEMLVNMPLCVIGMEACGGAHHWAREIKKLGHQVRVIAPQFAAPYRPATHPPWQKTVMEDVGSLLFRAGWSAMRPPARPPPRSGCSSSLSTVKDIDGFGYADGHVA